MPPPPQPAQAAPQAGPQPSFVSHTLQELPIPQAHALLLGAVAPRPIALASTVDAEGRPNLAPFSYFNVFSTRPPLLIFSPNRAGRTGQQKDTALNLAEVPEVVVNVVNHAILHQMNLSSAPFARGVDEFAQAGFTPLPSEVVRPSRVAESPIQLECRLQQLISLGEGGGSGNLALCEVVRYHVRQDVLDAEGLPDMHALDLMGRLGGLWYTRAQTGLQEVPRPLSNPLGWAALPASIASSPVLTGNHLGQLAGAEAIPTPAQAASWLNSPQGEAYRTTLEDPTVHHRAAADLLDAGRVDDAWMLLVAGL